MTRSKHPILITLALALLFIASMLAAQGLYHVARADAIAAAQPAAAVAPPAAAPPSIDDAVTAYRAGQWTAFALAVFGVGLVLLRRIAKVRGPSWLGPYAEHVAGAAAVLAVAVAYAVKVGGFDPAVMGTVITAIGAVIFHGTAPSPRA